MRLYDIMQNEKHKHGKENLAVETQHSIVLRTNKERLYIHIKHGLCEKFN